MTKFVVYAVTGPTGKQYVGVTKNLKARWASHIRRAFVENRNHPFYAAIRKHGAASFSVAVVDTFSRLEDALAAEVSEIFARGTTQRSRGYNVSRGGEYDSPDGGRKFWEDLIKDPERRAAYLQKLREAGEKRALEGRIDPRALLAYNAALPARVKWERQHRATRLARKSPNRGGGARNPRTNPEALRAAWEAQPPSFKRKHSIASRENAKALWARRTEEDRKDVADKIRASVSALSDDPEYRARNLAGLAKGRANMDRKVQGAAASAGLKKFWEELRSDPARYDEYMARRTASLKKTIASK